MPKDLIKEIGLEEETSSYRQGMPQWAYPLQSAVNFTYDLVSEPLRSSERIMERFRPQKLPQEMTKQESQQKIAEGPPTLGKAVGAVSDVVTDVASMVPGLGEEAIAGKVVGGKALPIAGAILAPQRMQKWQKFLKAAGKRQTLESVRGLEKAIIQIEKIVPEEFWNEQIKDIDPEYFSAVFGSYIRRGKRGSLYYNPASAPPHTIAHEVGHAVSHYLFNTAKPGSALAMLRGRWEVLRAISISAKDSFDIEGIAKMKFLTNKEREVLREWETINYRTRSEEIFARTFQRAVDEGMTFREATKMAAHGVHNTIEISQSHLERVLSAISEATKRSGIREKLSERTHEAFEEATELMKWFNDPAYRKGKQIPQLMEMFAKQNPGYTYKEHNELLRLLQDQSPQAVQKYWEKFKNVGIK